jgi:hypothetical protein
MLDVTGRRSPLEVGDGPLHQLRQRRAKIRGGTGSTDAMQIIQRPNHAGRAPVETGIAVFPIIVARVSGPEPVGIELGDGVRRNLFDRSPDSRFTPAVMYKRTMTTGDNHAGWSS